MRNSTEKHKYTLFSSKTHFISSGRPCFVNKMPSTRSGRPCFVNKMPSTRSDRGHFVCIYIVVVLLSGCFWDRPEFSNYGNGRFPKQKLSVWIFKTHLFKGIFHLEISERSISSVKRKGIFVRINMVHYNCNKTRTYLYTIWF